MAKENGWTSWIDALGAGASRKGFSPPIAPRAPRVRRPRAEKGRAFVSPLDPKRGKELLGDVPFDRCLRCRSSVEFAAKLLSAHGEKPRFEREHSFGDETEARRPARLGRIETDLA